MNVFLVKPDHRHTYCRLLAVKSAYAKSLTAALAVFGFAVIVALPSAAQNWSPKLFLESGPDSSEAPPLQAAILIGRARFATLNPAVRSWLATSLAGLPLRLTLNLTAAEEYQAVFEQRELLQPGRVVFTGHLEGRPGSYVTLALSGGAIAGSVFVPGRGMFQIQHSFGGWQRIVEASGSEFPSCATRYRARPTTVGGGIEEIVLQAASSAAVPTNSMIDLLVVYTTEARDGAGGTDGMSALIDAAVAEANLAFANSEVNARLRLVHRAELEYRETGDINEDLDRLEDDGESGPLYGVRQLRGQYRADLVCMITERTGGPFGLANQMHEVEVEFGQKAFSVVKREFAISYQALAHELGHNMGCQHDRITSPAGGAYDFSHAHRFEVDGTLYHTVMAYQPGLPIPYFSNPDAMFLGVPTGIAEPSTNSANNAKTINLAASTVARFDSVMPRGTPPQVAVVTPTNGAYFTVPAVVELVANASDADGQILAVEFYVNGSRLGFRTTPPFTMLWTNSTAGTFSVSAEVVDDAGWEVSSPRARVTMNFPPPFIDLAASGFQPDGTFRVRVRGVNGQAFRLDASPNLTTWSLLTTDSFLGDLFDFEDVAATNLPWRFYRVVPVP